MPRESPPLSTSTYIFKIRRYLDTYAYHCSWLALGIQPVSTMTNEFDNHAAFYNSLLIVQDAAAALNRVEDRRTIFEELTRLLARYPNGAGSGAQFGICLVHRHFRLYNGEKMVSDGDIARPQSQPGSPPIGDLYPASRWTAEGKPFEFTRDETKPLPDDLPPKFQAIVNKYDVKVLGLYYVEDPTLSRGVGIERLDSGTRSHIVRYGEPLPPSKVLVETDWVLQWQHPEMTPLSVMSSVCINGTQHRIVNDSLARVDELGTQSRVRR